MQKFGCIEVHTQNSLLLSGSKLYCLHSQGQLTSKFADPPYPSHLPLTIRKEQVRERTKRHTII